MADGSGLWLRLGFPLSITFPLKFLRKPNNIITFPHHNKQNLCYNKSITTFSLFG